MSGYERRDVRTRWVLVVLVMMAAGGIVLHAPVWYLFSHYRAEYQRRDVRRTQLPTLQAAPPEPLLEVSPTANWDTYRAEQDKELKTYAWVSREQKRVRIPIEHAMELMAEGRAVEKK